ncbi:hypothetical protein GUJ93_ZPchr0009g1678 [Zizania palustris]|uniref:Uncharacterized protein n=1 Tax=Zizania palustris TaxID=103762 RepID=A0A8J5V6R7_ZIZPA|nr:hypothetical protein GUJ93_ZPchr0009g1678 [Zizania palustris]
MWPQRSSHERADARTRPRARRRRRRLRQPERAGLPVRDGAGAGARHAQQRLPDDDHLRSCGVLFANLINYGTAKISGGWGWWLSLALAGVPAIVMTAGALFLPESVGRGGRVQ